MKLFIHGIPVFEFVPDSFDTILRFLFLIVCFLSNLLALVLASSFHSLLNTQVVIELGRMLKSIFSQYTSSHFNQADRKAKEEIARQEQAEAARRAAEEAERREKEEAERKAREAEERLSSIEIKRKMKEQADKRARLEAERKAAEEAEREAREEAEQLA